MAGVKRLFDGLGAVKYALIVAALGLVLLLWPSGAKTQTEAGAQQQLEQVLGRMEGVGEVRLILSEQGAVVVCAGADNAAVKLDICRAVQCYTGLGSDRIQVFKLTTN